MVLMSVAVQRERADRLLQSVDFAVKQLLNTESDPLALAMYLWVFRNHGISLVNSDSLANWGASWAYRTFVERDISRKRDEQITSAALAVAALKRTGAFADTENEIDLGMKQVLATELSHQLIPFKHPVYGAIFLFAA